MSEGMSEELAVSAASDAYITRQPFDLSDELAQKVAALGLEDAVQQVKRDGYGYIHDLAPIEFTERLREAVLRLSRTVPDIGLPVAFNVNMLLGKDPIFEELVLNPKLLAMAEVLCGKGALLSQLIASLKSKSDESGDGKGGLHSDQSFMAAPFPVHNQIATFCWACDEFSEAAGSTRLVPGSHTLRRHPNEEEIAAEAGAIATECPVGSVAFWDGSIWHSGSAPRRLEGDRVVVHISYSRLAVRPVESYDFLGEDWLQGKPFEMRVLLGREDFLSTPDGAFADVSKIARTMEWAKS